MLKHPCGMLGRLRHKLLRSRETLRTLRLPWCSDGHKKWTKCFVRLWNMCTCVVTLWVRLNGQRERLVWMSRYITGYWRRRILIRGPLNGRYLIFCTVSNVGVFLSCNNTKLHTSINTRTTKSRRTKQSLSRWRNPPHSCQIRWPSYNHLLLELPLGRSRQIYD